MSNGYRRGVNDSGGDFGDWNGTYDSGYHYDSQATFTYLKSRGIDIVRLPFRWEHVQPGIGQADYSTNTTLYDFEAGTQGWVTQSDTNMTLTQSTTYAHSGSAALKLTETGVASTGYVQVRPSTPAPLGDISASGLTLSVWIYCPSGQSGWACELHVQLSTDFSEVVGPQVNLASGAWTEVRFTVSTATAQNVNRIIPQILNNNGAAIGTVNFWIDSVTQGSINSSQSNPPLDPVELARLQAVVSRIQSAGLQVVLDVHNYARYTASDGIEHVIGDGGPITQTSLANLWVQLSSTFKNSSAVYAYGIMNEPHDMPGGAMQWQTVSQTVVNAIRNNGDTTKIMVPGYAYAAAQSWSTNHPSPWITDPANDYSYESHYYPDGDHSGRFQLPYANENSSAQDSGYADLADQAVQNLQVFTGWLSANGVSGFLGETGVSHGEAPSSWNAVLEAIYQEADRSNLDVTYWATGEWWEASYVVSCYHRSGGSGPVNIADPQASVVENHLSTAVVVSPQTSALSVCVNGAAAPTNLYVNVQGIAQLVSVKIT